MHVCRGCYSHHFFPSRSASTLGRLQFHPCDFSDLSWTDCRCNWCEQFAHQKALSYILVWRQTLGKQQTIVGWQVHRCCGCGNMYRCFFEIVCKNCIVSWICTFVYCFPPSSLMKSMTWALMSGCGFEGIVLGEADVRFCTMDNYYDMNLCS